MKTSTLKITLISLFILYSFTGFSQKRVMDISEFKTIPKNLVPDVDGKVLVDESMIQNLLLKNKSDIEIYPGWPIQLNGDTQRGGIYCNLDDDDELEVVYTIGQKTYAWNMDGSQVDGWPVTLQFYAYGAPACGDIDGDSEIEVVVSTRTAGTGNSGKVFAFEKDGSPVSGFPITLGGGATKTPVLADLNGDDVLEIIIEERNYPDGYVGVYYGDGTSYPGFPVMMDYIPASSVAVGDITGDDVPEIVAVSYYSIIAYDANGNTLDGFPFTPGNDRVFSYSSPVLADLDGDGNREIIVGDHSLSAGNGAVHILQNDGSLFPGWPKYVGNWIYAPPAVGDIDGDGNPDIAVGDQVLSGSPADKVYVWDKNGNILSGWPTAPIWAINSQILLTDLDGDNEVELMWDDNTSAGIYLGYNHDGSVMEGWPLNVEGSTFFINPFATDMNGDGILDLSGAGKSIDNSDCSIYLWNANVAINEDKSILPVLQYNVQHDGVYRDASLLQAGFIGSPLELCTGGNVQFTDLSTGNITSWTWTFEGGDPETSNEQNPEVYYENPGIWDVSLNVSDGSESDMIDKQDYIKIQYDAEIPEIPEGPDFVITAETPFTYYETSSANADSYIFELTPDDIGVIIMGDTLTKRKIYWDQNYVGQASLKVKAVNICGESDFSEALVITINSTQGISSYEEEQIFSVFPNPATNHINILFHKFSPSGENEITVFNIFGQKIKEIPIQQNAENISIDVEDWKPGLYFLRLSINGKTIGSSKVVVE
jgi:PKD repeat protein